MSEWISVKDKVPTNGKEVICITKNGNYFIGFYYDKDWHDEDDLLRGPTHWMPLPEPPK